MLTTVASKILVQLYGVMLWTWPLKKRIYRLKKRIYRLFQVSKTTYRILPSLTNKKAADILFEMRLIKRKVKAAREKLNQLEAEKLGHCPSAPPKKRKRETSHVSPENSKKQCIDQAERNVGLGQAERNVGLGQAERNVGLGQAERNEKKDATTKTVSSSSDSLPAFGPSQKDSSIHIPQDVTTYEQEVDIPTIEQAMELAKKIETDDHVEHDFDGIWEEIDDEYHTQHLPSVKVQNNVLVQNAGDGIWEEIDDEYHTQHLPSVECWE